MTRRAIDLTEGDLEVLASALNTSRENLAGVLRRRPWALNDMLRDPAVVELALGDDDGRISHASPNLFFIVVAFQAADALAEASWVADWVEPSGRLPVFDVEPLQEFSDNENRLAFIADLLAGFAAPEPPPVPANPLNLMDLVQWVDVVDPASRAVLLRQMGDVALFTAGVFPDAVGAQLLDVHHAEVLGRSVGMDPDEVLELIDPGSPTPGLSALEVLGAEWYVAAAAQGRATANRLLVDIANRMRPARRFLNHIADNFLGSSSGWALTP